MIAAPMCFFSVLQSPRCRIYTLANCLHGWTGRFGTGSKKPVIRNGSTEKWTRRSVATNSGGNKAAWSSEARSIKREILEVSQFQKIPSREKEEKEKETDRVTVIVFDIETTGFKRDTARIIEFACRDLSGGENSTFQTLVNPGCPIYNSDCHGITSDMVNKPHIPRISDFIPIFLRYVKSRQKHGGLVLLVAHNARVFDVPFLIHEFKRCSVDLPSDWVFLDTCPLAREMKKLNGIEGKISLQSLSQEFEIPVVGSAHRAMADVDCLSQVFQRLTIFLKLSRADLVGKSFTVSDLKK